MIRRNLSVPSAVKKFRLLSTMIFWKEGAAEVSTSLKKVTEFGIVAALGLTRWVDEGTGLPMNGRVRRNEHPREGAASA